MRMFVDCFVDDGDDAVSVLHMQEHSRLRVKDREGNYINLFFAGEDREALANALLEAYTNHSGGAK